MNPRASGCSRWTRLARSSPVTTSALVRLRCRARARGGRTSAARSARRPRRRRSWRPCRRERTRPGRCQVEEDDRGTGQRRAEGRARRRPRRQRTCPPRTTSVRHRRRARRRPGLRTPARSRRSVRDAAVHDLHRGVRRVRANAKLGAACSARPSRRHRPARAGLESVGHAGGPRRRLGSRVSEAGMAFRAAPSPVPSSGRGVAHRLPRT